LTDITFFFDRCVGVSMPKTLRNTMPPFNVEYHSEKKNGFRDDLPDDEWLTVVSQKKWLVVTHDKLVHDDSMAKQAVEQYNGRVFYLDGGSAPKWEKLRLFIFAYKKIIRIVKQEKAPFIYRITRNDRIIKVRKL
jgi:hypothetical protein